MSDPAMRATAPAALPQQGLLARLMANGLGLLLNRLELALLELTEARGQLFKRLMVLAMAAMAVWFAVAYASLLLVYVAWDSLGWKILLLMLLGFASLAAGLLRYADQLRLLDSAALPATLAALRQDRDHLL
ncbi:phage holin family protein [Chitinimonas sp. BJYL2]|uniref:phage holin family protein n=1 Tax=Chitinimonas sp. BJYL2 TaxID=2976696 RepID=UPI0022B4394D|nr:phage holin family protein [Chitinimonas sp. BJYL2]